ncbi:MAG: bL17 family ribosomal protein [Microgenomates group bacterium]|nr:L17 family ribosomal protein [Candidatus Woesebacteria bacterium]MBP6882879.1 L17 family ribosomal protein [Candidatus Woesebacteria bacterium]QQR63541.1 MAG: L17 family ribosomal protein [Candidatus Roizmanbacteria bacterium]
MNHRVSKRKFGYGVDSNSMLLRKLVTNFVMQGKIVTTHQKALYMRASVDRLVTHAKKDTNSSMNMLKSFFGVDDVPVNLKKAVKGVFADRTSGFTRITKIGRRSSDGALMAQISWVSPVIYTKNEAQKTVSAKPAAVEKPKKKPEVKATLKASPKGRSTSGRKKTV